MYSIIYIIVYGGDSMFVTIVGATMHLGIELFRVGGIFYLEKDIHNVYDDEAICVKNADEVIVGYLANSVQTVAKGCYSAGRIYDIMEKRQKIVVRFIVRNSVLAEIIIDNNR